MTAPWIPSTDDIRTLVTVALTGDGKHTADQAHDAFSRWLEDHEARLRQQITHDTAVRRIEARRTGRAA